MSVVLVLYYRYNGLFDSNDENNTYDVKSLTANISTIIAIIYLTFIPSLVYMNDDDLGFCILMFILFLLPLIFSYKVYNNFKNKINQKPLSSQEKTIQKKIVDNQPKFIDDEHIVDILYTGDKNNPPIYVYSDNI
jgi:Na+/melibiose symporter-like transporter